MKIIFNVLVYKRPEVLLKVIKSFPDWGEPVFCLSPEDEYLAENKTLIELFGYDYMMAPNLPVSRKHNIFIDWLLENKEFDYLMNVGSDDFINPDLIFLYEKVMRHRAVFFGIGDCYFWELSANECVLLRSYNNDHCIGGGRMISINILSVLKDLGENLYPDNLNSGLDNASRLRVKEFTGVDDLKVETNNVPYILDLKTSTNINTMQGFGRSIKERFEEQDLDNVLSYFKHRVPSRVIFELENNFIELHKKFRESFKTDKAAFEWLNTIYVSIFGHNKFNSSESFRTHKYLYGKY